jgi:hypothetical protein
MVRDLVREAEATPGVFVVPPDDNELVVVEEVGVCDVVRGVNLVLGRD